MEIQLKAFTLHNVYLSTDVVLIRDHNSFILPSADSFIHDELEWWQIKED